mgnify:CR=1 FL=1
METNSDTEKSTKEVLYDYVKEIIGYENGLWRTVVELRKHPDLVLKGYLSKDPKYVGPFRVLISALSLWVLVNSFFLDWHSAFRDVMYKMADWVQSIVSIPEQNRVKFDKYLLESANLYAKLAGDLFAKYYVPFVLIGLPLTAFLASKKCKKYGIGFKTILAAISYTVSLNVMLMFVVSVCAYFDIFFTFIVLGIPLIVLQLIGKGDLISFLTLRKFFSSNGIEIEKNVTKSMLISTLTILLPGMLYFFYYVFFVIVNS